MIDISLLRDRPEELVTQLSRRGVDIDVPALAEMEARIRGLRHEADEARAGVAVLEDRRPEGRRGFGGRGRGWRRLRPRCAARGRAGPW